MKRILLATFSGTGNTALVADMIRASFEQLGCSVDVVRMEDVLSGKVPFCANGYDWIGLGSPVIGFSIPLTFQRFIRQMPKTQRCPVFIFRTAGGVAPINFNASKRAIRMLTRKGYDVCYERVFSINSNWITRFDDRVAVQLVQATQHKVDLMCGELLREERKLYKTKVSTRILMGTFAFVSPIIFRIAGKDLRTTSACSHCGHCAKNCPAQNIREQNGKIRFGFSCNCCLRCVYACPKKAIEFRMFKSFPVPGGYDIRTILQTQDLSGTIEKEPRFFREYLVNDSL